MYFLHKMGIFHCHVSLAEGISRVGLGLGLVKIPRRWIRKAATSGASALDATLPFDELALVTENVGWPTQEKKDT